MDDRSGGLFDARSEKRGVDDLVTPVTRRASWPPRGAASEDRELARKLTLRYVVALSGVAVLLAVGQLLVQISLTRQATDARVVNVAGRQRMLSQRICVALLSLEGPGSDRARWSSELARASDEWESAQRGLREGDPAAGLPGDNSARVRELFGGVEPNFRVMLGAAHSALAHPGVPGNAQAALAEQDAFLTKMNDIVWQYESEAHARVATLRETELALLGSALFVLLLEGLLVFRPAVRGLGEYLLRRDRAERELLRVSDREQQRVAEDLHDGLAQHLVGIAAVVKTLGNRLSGGPLEEDVDLVATLLAEGIEQVRAMARSLRPFDVDASGFADAMDELAAATARVFGVSTVARVSSESLSPTVTPHLYRIAREAVTNAAKHARASRIEITLERIAGDLVLRVRDDGVGAPQPLPTHGMGISLMFYRARLLGASLEVRAASPRGTEVRCTLRPGKE